MVSILRLIACWLLMATVSQAAGIRYTVQVDTVDWSGLELSMIFTAPQDTPAVALPNWMPGAWMMADYARHLTGVRAENNRGVPLTVEQTRSNSWRIHCLKGESVQIYYRHNSSRRGFMGRKMTAVGGTLFGAPTFLYLVGEMQQPLTVELRVPLHWRIHTGLDTDVISSIARMYKAADYHQLVDSPFLLGECDNRNFQVGDKWIQLVLPVEGDFDRAGFQSMVAAIVEQETAFFGSAPFERFLFFIHYIKGNSGGGGLEHRNSTSIGLPLQLLQTDMQQTAPILAHELFHAWNMKHFCPSGFREFGYEEPLRTNAFWLGEGVTEYYGWLLTLRAGLLKSTDLLDKIAREIALLEETAARDTMSVADASRTVWEQGYAGGGVSFYNKGYLVGLALDFEIRQVTSGQRSLDDYMRLLNERFGAVAGYSDADLVELMSEVVGQDMSSFYSSYIDGTVPLDYNAILAAAGLQLKLERNEIGWAGDLTLFGPEHRFYMVGQNTPLGIAGVKRGDALLAIDAWQLTSVAEAAKLIAGLTPETSVELLIERSGEEMRLPLLIAARDQVAVNVTLNPDASSEQQLFYRQWLSGVDKP